MRARVFLSYARSDGTVACDFFKTTLQNVGYDVWRDIENLPGGAPWRQKIEDTIRIADVVLLFLTQGAIASKNVEEEWKTAVRFQKRIIPLIVQPVSVPAELLRYNYRSIEDRAAYEVEPSVVQRDLVAEQAELTGKFKQLRTHIETQSVSHEQQKYLEPFVEYLRMVLAAEPTALPPEVLRMMFSLLSKLTDELIAGNDITSLVESMVSGTYTANGWEQEPIYKLWITETAQALKKVRDAIPTIPVHVVVVAMTRAEAEDLQSGQAFAGLPAEWMDNFNSIRPVLATDWLTSYGATSEDWKPFSGEGSIAEFIRSELQRLSQDIRTPLRYSFVEIRDLYVQRKKLLDLRSNGCLVVMDAISCLHPYLQAAFRNTSLDVSPSTLVVRVAPSENLDMVLSRVGFLLREWLKCEFFQRANIDLDERCETVTQLTRFRKWMFNRLKDAAPGVAAEKSNLRPLINNLGR